MFAIIFVGCLNGNNINSKRFSAINYIMSDTIFSSDTMAYQTRYKMVFNGDVILYEVPVIKVMEFGTEIDSGRIYKKLKPYDTVSTYYITKKGLSNGLRFDSLGMSKPKSFRIDSLLKALNLDTASLKVYGVDLGKPLSITTHKNIEIEKFGKLLETDPDSIYRYYDENLNNLPFSFSSSLDKKKMKKLWKTVYIYNQSIDKNNKPKPRVKAITKIEEIKIDNVQDYQSLFQTFEKYRYLIKEN